MESIKVFAGAILYLKSHFLKTFAQRMYAIDIPDISWVLTVPAIWNDSSKLFATEAAKEVFIMHYTNTCMYITINIERFWPGQGLTSQITIFVPNHSAGMDNKFKSCVPSVSITALYIEMQLQ